MGQYNSSFANQLENAVTLTATAVTLDLTQADKTIYANAAGGQTYTVPADADVDFPIGSKVRLVRWANQTLTVVGDSGVTVVGAGSALTARARYSQIELVKVAADSWRLNGDVTTA